MLLGGRIEIEIKRKLLKFVIRNGVSAIENQYLQGAYGKPDNQQKEACSQTLLPKITTTHLNATYPPTSPTATVHARCNRCRFYILHAYLTPMPLWPRIIRTDRHCGTRATTMMSRDWSPAGKGGGVRNRKAQTGCLCAHRHRELMQTPRLWWNFSGRCQWWSWGVVRFEGWWVIEKEGDLNWVRCSKSEEKCTKNLRWGREI